jgi:4-oxalomesaconate hydratase
MSTDLLVVSAHAADYVWRSGGTIAKYVQDGKRVQIIVLSYGERGESADLWKRGGTLESIKVHRREESQRAADILGAPVIFLDWDDYPLIIGPDRILELVKYLRQFQPINILTHGPHDPFNPDHETTAEAVHRASVLSIAHGVLPELPVCKQPRLFGYEHHQPELSAFHPDIIVDITDAFERKRQAMECFQTQKHLIEYYAMRAAIRGNHARRVSGNGRYQYAEAFMRWYPLVGGELI